MPSQWYALHVKPHKERIVNDGLKAKDLEIYYPVLKKKPVNPRSRKEQPFFPGYFFVYLDLDEFGPNALKWTEGTYGLVEFGGQPAAVPDILIKNLKNQITNLGLKGDLNKDALKTGDPVRIVTGPFEGYEAIFDAHLAAKDRIQVMLTFLRAQPKKLQLESSKVIKVRR
ncbi:MAG: transcription termination/antitermination protein NusG [Anaerolineae bacterium]|nr:MAG: transcription termination/antitermination protein NusG [Anaerolineae bacterium]